MPGWVAVVDTDVDGIRFGTRHCINKRAHAFYVGEITRGRHVLSRGRRIGRIDGIDVVILVAGFVLDEEYVLAIARPEVSGDRALRVGRDRLRVRERLGRLLHPDIACALERFDKRDERPVRGNLRARDLWIAKEKLTVDYGRTLRPH